MIPISQWFISRWLVHLFISALVVEVSDDSALGYHVEPRLLYRWVLLAAWWAWMRRLVFAAAICGLLLAAAAAWLAAAAAWLAGMLT
jgi:hypothetical protein